MNSKINIKKFLILLLLILIELPVFSQQNPIKSYDGIPVVTYARGVDASGRNYIPPQQYDTIKSAGINFIQVENMTGLQFNTHIEGKGLMVLPEQYFYNQQTDKYITYYTEGRYTEWPTVGTDTTDGKATLKSLETHTEKYEGVLRTNQTNGSPLSHDTIVFGPQYWQDIYYRFHNQTDTTIRYFASFRVKLEELIPQESQLNDTICILQVTAKDTYIKNVGFVTYLPVYVIKQKVVTYGELLPLNSYKTFNLDYTLEGVPDSISDHPIVGNQNPQWSKSINGEKNVWAAVNNIEFRIIWKSNSETFRLYMDTIRVFDQRGNDLMTRYDKQQLIIDQVNLAPYNNSVAGWMSVDEPMSIDQMAPLKKVRELIESVQPNTGLWVNFNGGWNGRYGNVADPGYTMKLERFDELMRRVKKANIWVVMNPFDWPYCPDSVPNYRETNLNFVDSILSKLSKAGYNYENLFYGLCYQAGNYYVPKTSQQCSREIEGYEFLYLSNLALLYGSKVLTPWQWFGGGGYTGIVNFDSLNNSWVITDKYSTLKDKIIPRLNNLMGKKLIYLKATNQFPKISYNSQYYFIQKIINTNTCTQITSDGSQDAFDIGFFTDSLSRDYFMLISRYYNSDCNPTLRIYFSNGYFQPYRNLRLTNYITGNTMTILSNQYLSVSMDKGDAIFYGVFPVIKYGGELIANDTVKTNTTLIEDMTINNNVNLIIDRGKYYTIRDTVTLQGSGFITGSGYLNVENNAIIKINNWSKSVFKGRESNRPKIIWGRFPTSGRIVSYKIYRAKGNSQFIEIGQVDSTKRQFIDSSTIIYDQPHPFSTYADYYVKAFYQPTGEGPISVSSASNIIRYDQVDGIAIDKLSFNNTQTNIEFRLEQNYPNPFNPTTKIRYSIPTAPASHPLLTKEGNKGRFVTLKVYDILGNEIATLVNEYKEAGVYETEFNASNLPSGVYIYRISVGEFVDVKKMLLIK